MQDCLFVLYRFARTLKGRGKLPLIPVAGTLPWNMVGLRGRGGDRNGIGR